MILYFSGTGNSRLVATRLAALLHERLVNIEEAAAPMLAPDEPLGIVFPVYGWGLPNIVDRFLRSFNCGDRYLWSVMTCGDDMGFADRCLAKAARSQFSAVFSVAMPNTYVCLPGFKVDAEEAAAQKVRTTLERLPAIAQHIERRDVCRQLHRGLFPLTKTYVLRPFFNRFLISDKPFRTTAACTACGLCARQCPVSDITIVDGHPQWAHRDCINCLRCFHHCPHRAIEWGSYTEGKQQTANLSEKPNHRKIEQSNHRKIESSRNRIIEQSSNRNLEQSPHRILEQSPHRILGPLALLPTP